MTIVFSLQNVKKSIACLLFGGSRKRLPDGLTRRGDINVLLLGDPGTAKSQLLKFVERVSPIAVYTSGKGSSAAGLTASVIRDPVSVTFRFTTQMFQFSVILSLRVVYRGCNFSFFGSIIYFIVEMTTNAENNFNCFA